MADLLLATVNFKPWYYPQKPPYQEFLVPEKFKYLLFPYSLCILILQTEKVPAYFTDYCQYSCECAKIAVEGLGIGTISPVRINPFRSPVRKLADENDMPWYSNGFFFNLIYQGQFG